ncbi:hypothetical protein ACKWTF_007383 [Chironomus riparius]
MISDKETSIDVTLLTETVVPAILGLTLAAILAVAACFCARKIRRQQKKSYPESLQSNTIPFQTPPRPTKAIRSPNGSQTHYLKKSPSPTSAKAPEITSSTATQQAPIKYSEENELTKNTALNTEVIKSPDTEQPHDEFGKLGTLVFKLRYINDRNALVVSVVRCRGLPSRNVNAMNTSVTSTDSNNVGQLQMNGKIQTTTAVDPYVKLQLLPEKQHKVKTRVVRNTRNPVYDEDFTFYGLTADELKSMSLHFVILSFDRYSRDDVIGEVICPVNTIEFQQIENQQVAYSREIQPRSLKGTVKGRGEILVSLCWQPAACRLTVVLLKARNLPRMDVTGLADPYVKLYMIYNGQRIAKKKTHVKKRTLSPVFNESFAFDIPFNEAGAGQTLEGVSLELMVIIYHNL